MSENLLKYETSPYLLQHEDNPVHWRPWGTKAFGEARELDRPILLSVGYAACHWCHVMAHESFEDNHTADLMNELFIPVKVDREEFPHVDALYQKALQMMGEGGGWPLTMFLTPDGTPFFGGTYFPKEERYGRPSFKGVLSKIAMAYHGKPEVIADNGKRLKTGLYQIFTSANSGAVAPSLLTDTAAKILPMMDRQKGGLKGAPKFPMTPVFDLLWQAATNPHLTKKQGPHTDMRSAVLETLTHISQGGIYDHVGGGFARYSVDDRWLVPHFEKMLYDNAALISLLTKAWVQTGDDLFKRRVDETIQWLAREMITEGCFAAAQDADSEGVEGKYYVWSKDEIMAILGDDDGAFYCQHLDISAPGNWEGHNIPNRLWSPNALSDESETRLSVCHATLLATRQKRIPPLTDDKILADWNGMMIVALADAGFHFNRPEWVKMAATAYEGVQKILQKESRYHHSWRADKHGTLALFSDYAWLALAGLTLYQASFDKTHLEAGLAFLDDIPNRFKAPDGTYYQNAPESLDIMMPLLDASDQVTASPYAVCLNAFAHAYALTGNNDYRRCADDLIHAHGGDMTDHSFGHASLITASHHYHTSVHIVIIGDPHDDAVKAALNAVRQLPTDHKIVQLVSKDADLPADHPAHGKGDQPTGTIFVCTQNRCSAPLDDASNLYNHIKDFIG